jgi:hypothetical protein
MRSTTETVIGVNIHPRLSAAGLASVLKGTPNRPWKQEQQLTADNPQINADPKQEQCNGLV